MWSFWLVCSLIVLLIVELGKFLNRVREILPFVTKDKILDDCFLSRRWKTKRSLHCCHRGGAFAFGPENTFANFDRCLEIGTDMIEIDVRVTKDNVPVLVHDETLDRTTNGTGKVSSKTWEQIQELDAAYHFRAKDGSFPLRGGSVRVPSLHDFLEKYAKPNPDLMFLIDVKDIPSVDHVLEAIDQYELTDRVLLGAVPPSVNRVLKAKKGKKVPLCTDFWSFFLIPFLYYSGLLWLYPLDCDAVMLVGFLCSSRLIETLHYRNRRVALFQPFTSLDNLRWMKQCKLDGVDVIISDHPDQLKTVLS